VVIYLISLHTRFNKKPNLYDKKINAGVGIQWAWCNKGRQQSYYTAPNNSNNNNNNFYYNDNNNDDDDVDNDDNNKLIE
jgi:hypothetical protein